MPFKSKAQWKKCWAMKNKGQAGSWDCREWASETPQYNKLPTKARTKTEEAAIKSAAFRRLLQYVERL